MYMLNIDAIITVFFNIVTSFQTSKCVRSLNSYSSSICTAGLLIVDSP